MNTKQKGSLGLIEAISYFGKDKGMLLSLPIDSAPYDLVIDNNDGSLKKVQCKYTTWKRHSGIYVVNLRCTSWGEQLGLAKPWIATHDRVHRANLECTQDHILVQT